MKFKSSQIVFILFYFTVLINPTVAQDYYLKAANGPLSNNSFIRCNSKDTKFIYRHLEGIYKVNATVNQNTGSLLTLIWEENQYTSLDCQIFGFFIDNYDNLIVATSESVYVSKDDGNSWQILCKKISPDTLVSYNFVFESDNSFYVGLQERNGLYVSYDNWQTWSNIAGKLQGIDSPNRFFGAMDSNYFGHLFIAVTVVLDNFDVKSEIYRSTDKGIAFTKIAEFNGGTYNLIIDKELSKIYLISTDGKIYYSTNNGVSWESESLPDKESPLYMVLDYKNSKIYVCSSSNVFVRSKNLSSGWSVYADFRPMAPIVNGSRGITSCVIDNTGNFYVAAYGGVYKTNTKLYYANWDRIATNFFYRNIKDIAVSATGRIAVLDERQIIATTDDNGVNWIERPFDNTKMIFDYLAFSATGGLYASEIRENYAVYEFDGYPCHVVPFYGSNIRFHFNSIPPHYLITSGAIYRSDDNVDNWVKTSLYGYEVKGLAISSIGEIYTCLRQGVMWSPDKGEHWLKINDTLVASEIIITPNDKLYAIGSGKVYFSTDKGYTWIRIETFAQFFVTSIGLDADGEIFLVGTTSGCLIAEPTADPKFPWKFLSSEAGAEINKIVRTPLGTFYAATPKGVVRLDKRVKSVVYEKSPTVQQQLSPPINFPNPFNTSTIIKYSLPCINYVELTIYNILGRKIKTLVNELQPAGDYEVVFDSSDLPSGLYLCILRSSSNYSVRKMLAVK